MKGNHLHIEDHDKLIKDTRTSAIISVDQSGYQVALKRRKHKADFDKMKTDITELKTLVLTLIQRLDK